MNIAIDVVNSVYESICRERNILSVVNWSEIKFIFDTAYPQSKNNVYYKNMCTAYVQDKYFPYKEGNIFSLKKVMNDMRYVLIHGSWKEYTISTGLLDNTKEIRYEDAQALFEQDDTVVCVNYNAQMDEYRYNDTLVIRDEFIPNGIGIVVHTPSVIPVIPIYQNDYGLSYPYMYMGFQINNSDKHCVFSVPY